MVAVAATLVGCSREPPQQATPKSCADERQLGCSNRTTARLPIKSASSFKAEFSDGNQAQNRRAAASSRS